MANLGSLDRVLRFLLGILLAASPFLFAESLGAVRYALLAVGAILIGTALFRFCPAYWLFGLRSCPRPKA